MSDAFLSATDRGAGVLYNGEFSFAGQYRLPWAGDVLPSDSSSPPTASSDPPFEPLLGDKSGDNDSKRQKALNGDRK